MNPPLGAIGAPNPVLSLEDISRAVAIEKDQRAIVVVGMDSIKPGMGISVEALAGASPNLLISGADIKDALLDNINQPEDVGEGSGDLLERFGGFEQRAFSIDAANDFRVKGINGLLEECGFFVNDGLHHAMQTKEFLLGAATLVDVGGDHERHGASNANKSAKEQRSVVIGREGAEPGEGTPSGKTAKNQIGARSFERAKTEGRPDRERQTKEGKAVPLGPEKRGRTEDEDAKDA